MGPEVGPAFQRLSRDTPSSNLGVRLAETVSRHVGQTTPRSLAFVPTHGCCFPVRELLCTKAAGQLDAARGAEFPTRVLDQQAVHGSNGRMTPCPRRGGRGKCSVFGVREQIARRLAYRRHCIPADGVQHGNGATPQTWQVFKTRQSKAGLHNTGYPREPGSA
eukprot:gene24312-biopygen20889